MKKFLSMIVLASIVVACNDDPEIDANVGRKIDIIAKTELVRTQLGSDGLQLLWEPNETIGVFGNVTINAEFNSSNTEAAETATFSGEVAQNDNTLLAYYPYVESATDLGAIPFTLATDQEQTGGVPAIGLNDLKYGKLVDQGNNKYTCAFQQCFSLVKFTVSLTDCEELDGYHLESIWLQSEDAVLTGDFSLNVSTGALTVGEATSGNVNLEFTDQPALTDEIEGWVILNPNVAAKSTINILLTAVDENGENPITATAELETLQALEAGCAYTIPLSDELLKFQIITVSPTELNFEANGGTETVTVTTDYEEITAESDSDWVTIEKTSDTEYAITATANESSAIRTAIVTFVTEDGVSATISVSQDATEIVVPDDDAETANCYMISVAGDYSFNATVMGNGASGVIADVGFHTTDAVISGGASAELLWQDTAGFITSVSYDSANGRVNYTAASNVGNAVIAVKDSAGTILWSWHIWGTGDRAVQDEVYTNQAGATFTVMDRNLGQLTMIYSTDLHTEGEPMYVKQDGTLYSEKAAAIETINCTLYQWGRKDPIPSATTRYDIANAATDISTSYPVLNYNNFSSADEATIEYSIQNPAYLIDTYKYTSNQIWEKDGNTYLWGGGSSTTYVQYMDNTSAVAGWTNEKTIYDPCPAGYRIANPYTWTGFVGGTVYGGTGRDGTITLNNAPASTFVDYNKNGIYSDDEKLTSWDTTNDVAIVDGKEKLQQDLRAVVSYYQVEHSGSTKWVIKDGDYLLTSDAETDGAVECNYITRYYAPVYCQGLFFKANDDDNNGSFYPMISFRNGSNGSFNTAGLGYYWSSGPGGSAASAYYLKLGVYSYNSSGNSLSIDVFDNRSGKRDALPVRCVKE